MAGEIPLRASCAAVLLLAAACLVTQTDAALRGGTSDCGSCTLDYDPVCGKDNITYSNKCFALCQLGRGSWRPGRCPHDELNPVAGCIGTARCAGNPCEQPWPRTCQNQLPTDAVCFVNPCTGIQYQGQDLAACAPLWVDPATKQLVRCRSACICTKEFVPVCGSDGETYNNACEAACKLGRDGNWTEGVCPRSCMCPMVYSPVCGSDGKTYSNNCVAACELGDKGRWTAGECGDLNPFAGCIGNVRCARNSCDDGCADAPAGAVCYQNTCTDQVLNGEPVDPCAAVWVDPVTKQAAVCPAPKPTISCSTNETAECFADPCSVSSCPADPTATCLASYCSEGTFQDQPVGPCEAVYVDADGNRVDCDPLPAVSCPSDVPTVRCLEDPCTVAQPPDCAAAAVEGAVCEASRCQNGVLFAEGTEVPPCSAVWTLPNGSVSVCNADASHAPPDCICATLYQPVCTTRGETFSSACRAQCAGQEVAFNGTCDEQADPTGTTSASPVKPSQPPADKDRPAGDCFCTMQYDPVCGTDGNTYGNACEAACAKQKVAHAGVCMSLPSCPKGKTVQCLADPCSVSSCPADPSARCLASYCSEGTFQDQPVGPCEAVHVDADGNRVDCNAALAIAETCSCPYTYDPVCAKANHKSRTYPNSCAAACANATITKTGKCQHCNGADCTIGKKNDVCLLNAPSETQCWAKKYECRAAEGTPAGRGLGRCLPRDNSTAAAAGKQGRRLHRHLLDEHEAA